MLDSMIRFSLRYRSLVLFASLAVLVYGAYLTTSMSIDVFPDLDRPRVVIITEAPGLATEEVEALVTLPIELALMGASGVQDVRSQSSAGLNVVYVDFDWSIKIRAARQTVSERLATLEGKLPSGVSPQMTPPSSIMGQIVVAGIYRQAGPSGGRLTTVGKSKLMAELLPHQNDVSMKLWRVLDRRNPKTWESVPFDFVEPLVAQGDGANRRYHATVKLESGVHEIQFESESKLLMDLRTIADWIIRPRLLKVTGVAEVFMQGGDRKQYQVLLDPIALLEYDVTLQDVERALSESNINASGGFAIQGESERSIRILGRLGTGGRRVIDDLLKIPVADCRFSQAKCVAGASGLGRGRTRAQTRRW